MEDEIQKRNTDCVYFLASPLTCKKGAECEYRHSEVARLNPRDCYYWLAGNCLNPTCAFRHPPLDGRSETSSEPAAALPQEASLPANKVLVPCYFYFNGFCNKGDRCSFLHGPNDVQPTPKVPKSTPVVNTVQPPENKASTGSDTLTTVVEAPLNLSRTSISKSEVNGQIQTQEDVHQSVPSNVVERSPSLQSSVPDCEEEAAKSDTPLPAEDFIGQSVSPEQESSEEQVEEEHIEREEWCESSPGLDVLVDNGSEGYENDQEYLPVLDAEVRRLHDQLLQYDYEDHVGYDPMEYTGAGVLYEDGVYDMYNGLEDEDISDYCQGVPNPSIGRNLDPMIYQKRKVFPREVEVNGRNGMDLREHLRKRKRIDGHQPSRNPRRRGPSFLQEKSQEHPRRHHMGHLHNQRLASEVVHNMIGFESEKERELNGFNRRSSLRQSEGQRKKSRLREKDKRRQVRSHHLSSEISSREPISRGMRGSQESTSSLFTGPKTLAQIREEKRIARENGEAFGNTRRYSSKITTSKDFEGPKPLSEILKEKKRLGSVSDDGSTRSKQDNHDHRFVRERGNHEDGIGLMMDEDEGDYDDDDDDDDGGLEKKLASIYS